MMELESCDTCTKPSENRKFNCPPRMSDGRHFTDYRSRCALNHINSFHFENGDMMRMKKPSSNSFDFRQHLIHNGEKLMEMNREEAFQRNMCGPCTINPSTMLPVQTNVSCNTVSCQVKLNDPEGLGQGRNYGTYNNNKFARNMFDMRRQEKNNNCCASSQDDAEYYPLDGKIDDDYGRLTYPSGGMPLHASDRVK